MLHFMPVCGFQQFVRFVVISSVFGPQDDYLKNSWQRKFFVSEFVLTQKVSETIKISYSYCCHLQLYSWRYRLTAVPQYKSTRMEQWQKLSLSYIPHTIGLCFIDEILKLNFYNGTRVNTERVKKYAFPSITSMHFNLHGANILFQLEWLRPNRKTYK